MTKEGGKVYYEDMENFTKTGNPTFASTSTQSQQEEEKEEYERFEYAQDFVENYIKIYASKEMALNSFKKLVKEHQKIGDLHNIYNTDEDQRNSTWTTKEREEARRLAIVTLVFAQKGEAQEKGEAKGTEYILFKKSVPDDLYNNAQDILSYTHDLDEANPGKYPEGGIDPKKKTYSPEEVRALQEKKETSLLDKLKGYFSKN